MTNRQLYSVMEGIQLAGELVNIGDINFVMSMAHIADEIQSEIRIIEDGKKKPSTRYKDYLKKKDQLNMKYAIQKEDGTFQIIGDSIILRDPIKYQDELATLDAEYKNDIDLEEQHETEFKIFLNQNCPKTITKIKRKLAPASMNVEQARLLFPIFED